MRTATEQTTARDLLALVLDPESFTSWDIPVSTRRRDPAYIAELETARERSGEDESILTGEGRVRGHRVAVVLSEFGFLGGSIGIDASERLIGAIERATLEGLPLLAAPASGGTRMQEGSAAFVQMISISAALASHRRKKLPYLVYLRHPTTGGALASWGSLGHVTVAEPGALIGFLGPRVYRAMYGSDFPEGVQRAEHLFDHGIVDGVLEAGHLSAFVARVLDAWETGKSPGVIDSRAQRTGVSTAGSETNIDDWSKVLHSRKSDRPGARSVLRHSSIAPVFLSGTGQGEVDSSLMLAIAKFGEVGAVVLGQDRRRQGTGSELGPEALRVAVRGVRLAEELGLPLVTLIDTPGASLSRGAEEGALAGEIARCMTALLGAEVPTVSLILGQGAGGAAIALLPADRVLIAENGWLSPLPPEGAATIRFRDRSRAPESAREQRIGANHLFADGIVDEVILETGELGVECARALERALVAVRGLPAEDRLRRRGDRFLGLPPGTAV